jgi:uncharacterized protein YhjY with autotransporter beta-barrel domain
VAKNTSDQNRTGAAKFSAATTADINGTLEFKYSNIDFVNGVFNVNSGGELMLDHQSSVYLKDLNINSGGKTTVASNGELNVSREINLNDGSELSLPSSARVNAGQINVTGNSLIAGSTNTSRIDTQVLQGQSGSTLQVNGLNLFNADTLLLANGFTVNMDDGTFRVKGDIVFNGGDLNLSNGADLLFFGVNKGNSGTVTANASSIKVVKDAVFELNDTTTVSLSNNASMEVSGEFYTGSNLVLSTDGTTMLSIVGAASSGYEGVISPGSKTSSSGDVIGTLTTDSGIYFTNFIDAGQFSPTGAKDLLDTGSFDGGYYLADLRLNGTTPENDQILYGDGDVNIAAMKAIKVRVHGNPTAAALDGKEFTVLAAQDGTKTGQIIRLGQALDIEEDSSVPVLIDFFEVDNQTNGKEDITLVAEEQLPITLQKHTAISGSRNKQSVAALMPASPVPVPGPNVPAQTPAQQQAQLAFHTALQSTTNGQVGANFASIHPEPFSSHLTVNLEQVDEILSLVSRNNIRANDERLNGEKSEDSITGKYQGGLWIDSAKTEGDVEGKNSLGDFEYGIDSLAIGTGFSINSDIDMGGFIATSKQSMDEHDAAVINFETDAFHVGFYTLFKFEKGYLLDVILGFGQSETESSRTASLGTVTEIAKAKFDAETLFFSVRGSKRFVFGEMFNINPFAALSYMSTKQDSFKEENAPTLGLAVESAQAESKILSLGVDLDVLGLANDKLIVTSYARYDYDSEADSNEEHEIKASLIHTPTNGQTFVGQNRGSHILNIGVGGMVRLTPDMNLGISVNKTISSNGSKQGFGINYEWLW